MVAEIKVEEPNLSYVCINQTTSPNVGKSRKAHIIKQWTSNDERVVNSGVMHPSLMAQPTPPTPAMTIFWGSVANEPLENVKNDELVESLNPNVSLIVNGELPPESTTKLSNDGPIKSSAPTTPINTLETEPKVSTVKKIKVEIKSGQTTNSQDLSKKRPLDDGNEEGTVKVFRVSSNKFHISTGKEKILKENQELRQKNEALMAENQKLLSKIDKIAKILTDPKQRDSFVACLTTRVASK